MRIGRKTNRNNLIGWVTIAIFAALVFAAVGLYVLTQIAVPPENPKYNVELVIVNVRPVDILNLTTTEWNVTVRVTSQSATYFVVGPEDWEPAIIPPMARYVSPDEPIESFSLDPGQIEVIILRFAAVPEFVRLNLPDGTFGEATMPARSPSMSLCGWTPTTCHPER